MKDNDKPFRNYPPKKENDNYIPEIISLFYNNQEDVSPLIEEVEKQFEVLKNELKILKEKILDRI